MKKSLLLLGGALVLFSNSAFGWGKMGHDAIAYIAECNLTPKAKKTIEKILGHSIVYYATRMDEWRAEPGYEHTSAWHTASVDKNLVYAPRPKGDVIFALEDAIAKLQDYKQQDDSTVVMSLRCIIHFVGDMHCPVHVKYANQKSYNVYLNGDKIAADLNLDKTRMPDAFSIDNKAIPTGIVGIDGENEAVPGYYNLQGLRVEKPVTGGVYIEVKGGKSRKVIY